MTVEIAAQQGIPYGDASFLHEIMCEAVCQAQEYSIYSSLVYFLRIRVHKNIMNRLRHIF